MEAGSASSAAAAQHQNLALVQSEAGSSAGVASQEAPGSKRSSTSNTSLIEQLPQKLLMKIASLALNRDELKLWGKPVLNVGDIRYLSKTFYDATLELVPPYLLIQNIPCENFGFYFKRRGFELKWHPQLAEILEAPAPMSSSTQRLHARLSQVEWIATNKQRWTINYWKTFFKLFHQTREEHAQRLHQLAGKIGAGWFPNLKALYLYTLDTPNLIKFLDIAFPVRVKTQSDAATVSTATPAEVSISLEKLDFRTDNWDDALLERLKVLAEQFPKLRFGNGLGMHDAQVIPDNQLLTLQRHIDYAFWDEKLVDKKVINGKIVSVPVLPAELRNKILQWMQAVPDSPMARQARNIIGYTDEITGKHHGQSGSFIRQMKRGHVSGITPMQSVT